MKITWTAQQSKVIKSRHSNLLVSAAAGSGKTAVLVERIIEEVLDKDNPIDIDSLLVVTFTNAAANQMKEKIRAALIEARAKHPGDSHLAKQIILLDRANIMTIDGFCLKVVRENFNKLGITPSMRVADNAEMKLIKADVLSELLERHYEASDERFIEFVDSFTKDKSDTNIEDLINKVYDISSSYSDIDRWFLEAGKALEVNCEEDINGLGWIENNIRQAKLVLSNAREYIEAAIPICDKNYGPFKYKTTAYLDMEYVDRLLACNTYNDFYMAYLEKLPTLARCSKKDEVDPELAEEFKGIREIYKKLIKDANVFSKSPEGLMTELSLVYGYVDVLIGLVREYIVLLGDIKRDKGIMEFQDIEHMASDVLREGYKEDGTPIRSKIARTYGKEFNEIIIDEYQDSNFLQEDILYCVSRCEEGEYNIFMVGDVKQSIYKFRQARPDIFLRKYHTYSDVGNEKKIELNSNFRSREQVLDFTNYIFGQIMTEQVCGIDYDERAKLYPGREFPRYDDEDIYNSEVIIIQREDTLEEDGKIRDEARVVADRIKELIGVYGDRPQYVLGEEGEYRIARYSDITILLRSMKNWSDIFSEVFMENDIPVDTVSDVGFYNSHEIKVILAMLAVIDNMYMDVELAAVFKSYIGRLTDDELARLRIAQRRSTDDRCLYEAAVYYIEHGRDKTLRDKLSRVIGLIDDLKNKKVYMSIRAIIREVLDATGYFEYVGSMSSGKKRQANIMFLVEQADNYENTSYRGIFNFLRYIKRVKDYNVDYGEIDISSTNDVVHIMSIHKSKGLEFPIVFVSGTGKGYNYGAARDSVVIHPDYFFGTKLVNLEEQRWENSLVKQSISRAMIMEDLAEEMRVLYVALTRAQEKLIVTGCCNNVIGLIDKYKHIVENANEHISYSDITGGKNYLQWIIMSLMRNKVFNNACNSIPPVYDDKNGEYIYSNYELVKEEETKNFLEVRFINDDEIERECIEEAVDFADKEIIVRAFLEEKASKRQQDRYTDIFNWHYNREEATKIKGKLSVTELKLMANTNRGKFKSDAKNTENNIYELSEPTYPEFIKTAKVAATTVGTTVHKVMELIDFNMPLENVKPWIESLTNEGILDKEAATKVDGTKICNMLNTTLGRRMACAQTMNKLYTEKQFVAGLPATMVYQSNKLEDDIIIQGVIDAYFEEEDSIIIVDYKTDRVASNEGEQELIDHYKVQLDYYGIILGKLTGKAVTEKYIYSFALDKAIRV